MPLLWAIPLLPLLGFLLIAFLGAGITKSPRPVADTGDATTDAAARNAGPSDAPVYDMETATAASGHDDTGAPAHHGPGAHDEAHLDKGGTKLIGGLATALVGLSFLLSVVIFLQVVGGGGGAEHRLFSSAWEWMRVPALAGGQPLSVSFQLAVDPLTALMLLIITGVGTLIHLYSTGYMSHDKGYARYFAYLNLFVFFMLLLVMGANFLVMFIGWEGVGLASYLLIGYFYERRAAGNAAKKAFIVNRVGDAALLVALFFIFKYFGTFDMFGPNGVLTQNGLAHAFANGYNRDIVFGASTIAATMVPLLLFVGAAGKSAQIPLYVWLPDAMEGPTPVSALIHAATMVTGGVYLVSRAHVLFLLSPTVMTIVAVIGLVTAVLAASIALVQNDIKKVLAYSTVSQLGYMFLACGVGAFGTAMFHVMTHAFFKALLFLCAGSVIHAMGGEQDMRKMGGLASRIPKTYRTMFIGALAISGIPPLAGFFSKDEILANAFAGAGQGGLGNWSLWVTGWIVSGLTAFYMWRMMGKTFAGTLRADKDVADHIHESPASMTAPLWILAGLSTVGGFLGGFAPLHIGSALENFLGETVDWRKTAGRPLELGQTLEVILVLLSVVLAVVISLFAWNSYKRAKDGQRMTDAEKQNNLVTRAMVNLWGVDAGYNEFFGVGGKRLATMLWRGMDARVIDGTVNGVAGGVGGLANLIKGAQSGYVRNYALSLLIGAVVVVVGCLVALNTGALVVPR